MYNSKNWKLYNFFLITNASALGVYHSLITLVVVFFMQKQAYNILFQFKTYQTMTHLIYKLVFIFNFSPRDTPSEK